MADERDILRDKFMAEFKDLARIYKILENLDFKEHIKAQILWFGRLKLSKKYIDMRAQHTKKKVFEVNQTLYGNKYGPDYKFLKDAGLSDLHISLKAMSPAGKDDPLSLSFKI